MRFLIIFIFFISNALASEIPNIKNIVVNKELKTYDNIEFLDSKEKVVRLSDYKGNLVMLNFWATWCAPCREEIPELNDFYKKTRVQLIGIAIDGIDDVIKFQEEVPIHYPSLVSNDMEGVNLAKSLGNERGVLPFTVIISPDGSINNRFYGKVKISDLNQSLSQRTR
jgi:thiol-disulfide isomerase/thioredoxin